MAIQYVNTGTSANKGDGDTLRVAFGKINSNFSQLTTLIEDSSATITVNSFPPLDPTPGELWFDTISGRAFIYYDNFWVDANPPAVEPVTWNTLTTDIISFPPSTYNLGSTSSFWKNLFVDTVTTKNISFINTNTLKIQTGVNNSWQFTSDNKLLTTLGTWTSYIKNSRQSNSTRLELVPDQNLYSAGRYIIVEPLSGDDIHIRPGGDVDVSFANLKIGGEKINLEISNANDGAVYINAFNDGFFPVPDTQAQWKFNSNGSIVVPQLQGNNTGHLFTATGNIVLTVNLNKWIFTSTGELIVPGSIIPAQNLAFDLGSTSSQWRSLYVGTSTIYIGGTALSVSGGTLSLNGNPISGGGGGNANTGDLAFTATTIATTAAGDITLDATDGNVIIKTGIGTYTFAYDAMSSVGYLEIPFSIQGPEQTGFTTPSGYGISIDSFSSPASVDIGNVGGGKFLRVEDGTNPADIDLKGFGKITLRTDGDLGPLWAFNTSGGIDLPGGANIFAVNYSAAIRAGNDGTSTYGVVNIQTNNPSTTSTWSFGTQGEITLPGGGVIQENQITNELFGTTTTSLSLYPGGSSQVNQRLEIYATVGGEGDHLHLTAGDQTGTDLYLGNDSQYVKIEGGTGHISLVARTGIAAPNPGESAGSGSDIYFYAGDAGSNNGNPADGAAAGSIYLAAGASSTGTGGVVQISSGYGPQGYGFVEITTDGNSSRWKFNKDNELEYPDGTVQSTAYRFVNPPLSSTSTGIVGALAQDATYFYVCTATNAWQRISWDNTPW